MTTVGYRSDLHEAYGTVRHAKAAYAELPFLCLWSAAGLALSGLLLAMGFGAEIGQALMMAG